MKKFIDKIKNSLGMYKDYNEACVKSTIIIPILQKLGWDTSSRDEVYQEYSVNSKRVDIALFISEQCKFFIEAKRCTIDLKAHQEQLLKYSFRAGVELACLTNGITWQFFLPLQKGGWEKRLFYTIDIENQTINEIEDFFYKILSKNAVSCGDAVKNASQIYFSIDRKKSIEVNLPKAFNEMLTNPSDAFIDMLADKTENLGGFRPSYDEVSEFLQHSIRKFIVNDNSILYQDNANYNKEKNVELQNNKLNYDKQVKTKIIRGVELPLERIGNHSERYFKELLPKLLPILSDKNFSQKITTYDFPILSKNQNIFKDNAGYLRCWKKKICGYYVFSQWYDENTGCKNLPKWKDYLSSLD